MNAEQTNGQHRTSVGRKWPNDSFEILFLLMCCSSSFKFLHLRLPIVFVSFRVLSNSLTPNVGSASCPNFVLFTRKERVEQHVKVVATEIPNCHKMTIVQWSTSTIPVILTIGLHDVFQKENVVCCHAFQNHHLSNGLIKKLSSLNRLKWGKRLKESTFQCKNAIYETLCIRQQNSLSRAE